MDCLGCTQTVGKVQLLGVIGKIFGTIAWVTIITRCIDWLNEILSTLMAPSRMLEFTALTCNL